MKHHECLWTELRIGKHRGERKKKKNPPIKTAQILKQPPQQHLAASEPTPVPFMPVTYTFKVFQECSSEFFGTTPKYDDDYKVKRCLRLKNNAVFRGRWNTASSQQRKQESLCCKIVCNHLVQVGLAVGRQLPVYVQECSCGKQLQEEVE
jgi:hypothetical protein